MQVYQYIMTYKTADMTENKHQGAHFQLHMLDAHCEYHTIAFTTNAQASLFLADELPLQFTVYFFHPLRRDENLPMCCAVTQRKITMKIPDAPVHVALIVIAHDLVEHWCKFRLRSRQHCRVLGNPRAVNSTRRIRSERLLTSQFFANN